MPTADAVTGTFSGLALAGTAITVLSAHLRRSLRKQTEKSLFSVSIWEALQKQGKNLHKGKPSQSHHYMQK